MSVNFLDLFSGIGGFALGAHWAGLRFDNHYFSEVDPYAIRVYSARFPDALPLGDIRAIRGADLPRGDWIIAGGFPCQDISVAGKGAGLQGARSGLWYEYARIIGELRPKYAIMENVGALAFRGLDRVLGCLWEEASQAPDCLQNMRRACAEIGYVPETLSEIKEVWRSATDQEKDWLKLRIGTRNPWCGEWPGVPRVAKSIPARVDRLKCLGNSIVPQIAEIIFAQPAFDEWRINH